MYKIGSLYRAKRYFDGSVESYNRWIEGVLIRASGWFGYLKTADGKIFQIDMDSLILLNNEKGGETKHGR